SCSCAAPDWNAIAAFLEGQPAAAESGKGAAGDLTVVRRSVPVPCATKVFAAGRKLRARDALWASVRRSRRTAGKPPGKGGTHARQGAGAILLRLVRWRPGRADRDRRVPRRRAALRPVLVEVGPRPAPRG